METIIVNTYKFEELSETEQMKAIDQYRDINVEDAWWDNLIDNMIERLDTIGFINAEINFSGFCSQGDGLSFTADVDTEKIISSIAYCDRINTRYMALERLRYHGEIDLEFVVERNNSRYSHELTCGIDTQWESFQENLTDSGYDFMENLINSLENDIEELRLNLCQSFYQELETEYEYLPSDSVVSEWIIENDIEFEK